MQGQDSKCFLESIVDHACSCHSGCLTLFFFIKHYLKGSECALAALCTTSSLPVTVFLLSSALKLMNLAILRDPPVEIIGIISSLPVLNYRPVAI